VDFQHQIFSDLGSSFCLQTNALFFFLIQNIQLIGKTPIVYLNKLTEGCGAYIAVKQEMFQPTSSIKDRYLRIQTISDVIIDLRDQIRTIMFMLQTGIGNG
jgi:hypothetical protein